MFITGAISSLLPYVLFFGMMVIFAIQSPKSTLIAQTQPADLRTLHVASSQHAEQQSAYHYSQQLSEYKADHPTQNQLNTEKTSLSSDYQPVFYTSPMLRLSSLRAPPQVA